MIVGELIEEKGIDGGGSAIKEEGMTLIIIFICENVREN